MVVLGNVFWKKFKGGGAIMTQFSYSRMDIATGEVIHAKIRLDCRFDFWSYYQNGID